MGEDRMASEIIFEQIPLRPLGREEIHRLETALLIGTLFRPDVLQEIRESEERLTWIDSLAVAAGALARDKAGMSIREIAEDLGRSEGTIRNHLAGKTKAGKLVRETFEKLVRGELKVPLPGMAVSREVEELRGKVSKLEEELKSLREKYEAEKKQREELENTLRRVREELERIVQLIR